MGSNQYNIKYSSMDQFYVEICTKTQEWYKELDSWKTSYTSLINMTSFNGQSATAVKSYLGEVHEFLLQSIYVAISRFQADFLLYKNGYYNIEDNIYANISRDTIKSIENKLSNEIKYLNNIANEIDISLNSVSDIYWRGKPSKSTLEGHLNSEKNSLSAFNTSIENYESKKATVAKGELRSLLEALKSTIILYSGSTNSVLSYKNGDLVNNTQVLDLYKMVQSSTEYVDNNKEKIELAAANQEEVFTQMQKDYEEALEAREDEGRVKIITGALAIVVGGAAIFLTAGAATPIVVTAVVAGTSSAVYGASNIYEGYKDIDYALMGDLNSVAINPIRDTVFMGNQGAYDLWGNINMAVAGLCIPVSQAVNGVAGSSKYIIARAAITRAGKETAFGLGINYASSGITNFATNNLGLNKTESTMLNLGLNFGIGAGAYKLRTKVFGEHSFEEGMSYDDAKRYNDYWNRLESGNNTGYPGLTDADIKAWKFSASKLNERMALNKVDSNEVVKLRMKELEIENRLRVVDKGVSKADLLKNSGLDKIKVEEIVSIPKGSRPDPSTYLSKDYIEQHLKQFESGASYIMPKSDYDFYYRGVPEISRPDGTMFFAPKEYMDDIVREANGDISVIEKKLGYPSGSLANGDFTIVNIENPKDYNMHIPSGNEHGANSEWIPGGFTSGGVPEVILEHVPNEIKNIEIIFLERK
ncbi:MAG: hypothetical protein E7212_03025 [Clostridium sartagoforme]|nr:hypothetical protein [Clostridium sartagoforme]